LPKEAERVGRRQDGSPVGLLQWGRLPKEAERHEADDAASEAACLNGAASRRRRRGPAPLRDATKNVASMGPPPEGGGEGYACSPACSAHWRASMGPPPEGGGEGVDRPRPGPHRRFNG